MTEVTFAHQLLISCGVFIWLLAHTHIFIGVFNEGMELAILLFGVSTVINIQLFWVTDNHQVRFIWCLTKHRRCIRSELWDVEIVVVPQCHQYIEYFSTSVGNFTRSVWCQGQGTVFFASPLGVESLSWESLLVYSIESNFSPVGVLCLTLLGWEETLAQCLISIYRSVQHSMHSDDRLHMGCLGCLEVKLRGERVLRPEWVIIAKAYTELLYANSARGSSSTQLSHLSLK